MQATVVTFIAEARTGEVLLDDGTPMTFGAEAFATSGLRLLRVGQRVRLQLSETGHVTALTIITMSPLQP